MDALLARTDASGTSAWYLTDNLGLVRDIADVSGTVVYHTGYDSFGNNLNNSGTGGDWFGYTGREGEDKRVVILWTAGTPQGSPGRA